MIEAIISQPLPEVEKRMKSNFIGLGWEIEHTEDLRTEKGNKVKIFFGVTSPYGGINLVSFISHGGGYAPYYIKMTEVEGCYTQVFVAITGSETVTGDLGNRNAHIAEQVLEMCEKDCTNKTFIEKAKDFFK